MTRAEIRIAVGTTTALLDSVLDGLVADRAVARRKGKRMNCITDKGGVPMRRPRSWTSTPAVFSIAPKRTRRAR
jgi:hypothetical protein